jgi:hypothetical protein
MINQKLCCCGGGKESPHILGNDDCYREWVPKELASVQSYNDPHMWVMPGDYEITDYTLRHQRMYAYHPEVDMWSRTKDHESINSLDA